MMESNSTSVAAAFEMLLEEIEAEIDFVNQAGARALERGHYDKANEAIAQAKQLTDFRDKADALRREWENLFAREEDEEDTEARATRRNLGRLRRGQRTREEAVYRPILEALQALGGRAQVNEVLDHVLEIMRSTLRDVDFEPLTSDPDMPRWKNTAQWARKAMVKKGLLRNDSPRGFWEISAAGVRFLHNGGG
ncbi:winged helix-turn-helix domain-containing protein [Chloracidobacterium thermophilum]|uniref:winged helix-turn-helix domain-containing protein n=1 Tax=Chloracidobacterium thermophilum TaxID=458033 RepID=UPI000738C0E5|nr:winged helix-turn-helix domain-containing protein [Chloracidobacterium thermophilum]